LLQFEEITDAVLFSIVEDMFDVDVVVANAGDMCCVAGRYELKGDPGSLLLGKLLARAGRRERPT
jgi:hypothetical protein